MCAEGEQGSGGAREVGRSEGAPGERRSAGALGEQGGEGAEGPHYWPALADTLFTFVRLCFRL